MAFKLAPGLTNSMPQKALPGYLNQAVSLGAIANGKYAAGVTVIAISLMTVMSILMMSPSLSILSLGMP